MNTEVLSENGKNVIEKNLYSLLINRTEAMGVAMMMVLIYHLNTSLFYPGFLGVDIFLFLSGYGISRSYEINSIKIFYKHRVLRIVPIYIFMGIVVSMIYIYVYRYSLTSWDVICNISSLSYWGAGGIIFEWYLSFLLLLYLTFPVFIVVCKKAQKAIWGGYLLLLCLILVLLTETLGLRWCYDTAIGRIPIFVSGILLYLYNDKLTVAKFVIILFSLSFICAIFLYRNGKVNTYTLVYMLSPLCLFLLGWLLRLKLSKSLKNVFLLIGKYSLEIYVANVFVVLYRKSSDSIFQNKDILCEWTLYFLFNVFIAIAIVFINKWFKKYLLPC